MRETSIQRKAWPVVGVLLLAACGGSATREGPSQLRDTTGLTIPWMCSAKGCGTLADAPGAFQTCNQATGYDVLLDRLLYICAATISPNGSTGWHAADYRAVACSSDDSSSEGECVPIPDVDESCVDGFARSGANWGPYGLSNNCGTFVADVLDVCRRSSPSMPFDGAEGARKTCLTRLTRRAATDGRRQSDAHCRPVRRVGSSRLAGV
jgi:hypothetical protein